MEYKTSITRDNSISNGNTYNYKTADSFPFKKIRNYDKMKDNINIHTAVINPGMDVYT
jgi:hypothetical protein